MPRKTAAARVWPERPFDSKCRKTVPIDDDTVAQIRAFIAEWDEHDWPAVRTFLEVEVPGVSASLATRTVRDIRLLFNAIAHRGRGQRHTASTTVVAFDMPQPATLSEDLAWYQDECTDYQDGVILAELLSNRCTNQSRALTKKQVGLLVGDGKQTVDLQRPFTRLIEKGIVDTKQGVGVWLSWRGEQLARHLKQRKSTS